MDINKTDKQGRTPLFFAWDGEKFSFFEKLIQTGANLKSEAHDGKDWFKIAPPSSPEMMALFEKSKLNQAIPTQLNSPKTPRL